MIQSFLRPTYLNVHRTYGCPANPDRCRPQCHLCGKDFSAPQKLKAHIEAEHAGSDFGHCGTTTFDNLIHTFSSFFGFWKYQLLLHHHLLLPFLYVDVPPSVPVSWGEKMTFLEPPPLLSLFGVVCRPPAAAIRAGRLFFGRSIIFSPSLKC